MTYETYLRGKPKIAGAVAASTEETATSSFIWDIAYIVEEAGVILLVRAISRVGIDGGVERR
jgi:hypothetical protein